MAIADETTLRIVLYEGEGAASLDAGDRGATVTALLEQGYAVTCAGAGAVARRMTARCSCSAGLKTVRHLRQRTRMAQ